MESQHPEAFFCGRRLGVPVKNLSEPGNWENNEANEGLCERSQGRLDWSVMFRTSRNPAPLSPRSLSRYVSENTQDPATENLLLVSHHSGLPSELC